MRHVGLLTPRKVTDRLRWLSKSIEPIRKVLELIGKVLEAIEKVLGAKPSLRYVELHLTDHCNLNCKGCGHFSPIADKWYADPNEHAHDMYQLRKLFSTVDVIRLLGGEPLLHPKIEAFLLSTRSCFPKADIRIVTNGILLHEMPDSFWKTLRSCSIVLDITVYPPLKKKESSFIQLANSKGVRVCTHEVTLFHAFYNKKGDSKLSTLQKCRTLCAMLREGKIYICGVPALVHYFNKRFGTQIPGTGFADIYSSGLTGWDVKKLLSKASTVCHYCTLGWENLPVFPWSTSNRTVAEWDAETYVRATETGIRGM
jgi:organic radical activating enzyme